MDLKISDQKKILNVINTLKEKYRDTGGVSKFIAFSIQSNFSFDTFKFLFVKELPNRILNLNMEGC